jgi:hypothetical protein
VCSVCITFLAKKVRKVYGTWGASDLSGCVGRGGGGIQRKMAGDLF